MLNFTQLKFYQLKLRYLPFFKSLVVIGWNDSVMINFGTKDKMTTLHVKYECCIIVKQLDGQHRNKLYRSW